MLITPACSNPPAASLRSDTANTTTAPAGHVVEYPAGAAGWGKFRSQRFQLTVPLPDGRAWKIDDHHAPELIAVHPPTDSRLVIVATQEEALMNRERCEERARSRGWIKPSLTTVDDQVIVGPDAYDSRVWTALDAAAPGGAIEGHVFLFGAFLRRCLLVDLSTRVPAKEEAVLASRLLVGGARIVKAITLDPLRTTDDATVPRIKPEIRR